MKETVFRSIAKTVLLLFIGIVIGILSIEGAGAKAIEEHLKAYPSTHVFYLDAQQIELEAYVINGNNYVKLADIGKVLNFNVYWDGTVQIESTSPYTAQPSIDTMELDTMRQEIVRLVNQVRKENGVPELAVNEALMTAAQERAETMYTSHHTKEDCEAVIAHGYPYGFGANITAFTGAANSDTAQRAVTNWVNSPGHFETMIDPNCDTIGVGIAEDQYKTVCYLFVGNPKAHNPYE